MKRIVLSFILFLVLAGAAFAGQYFGVFGTGTAVDDTCRLCFSTFDTLGHSAEPLGDSVYILRFTRGTLIDSTAATKVRNYYWCATKKAFDGSNLGEYAITCYWRPCAGKWYNQGGFYTVELEDASGTFWCACDSCYQRLFPESGTAWKDSSICINPTMGADSLRSKIIYYHGTNPSVYDTMRVLLRPWW